MEVSPDHPFIDGIFHEVNHFNRLLLLRLLLRWSSNSAFRNTLASAERGMDSPKKMDDFGVSSCVESLICVSGYIDLICD